MPLKRLELFNFKSYKGTQVIEFGDAPFMCIIGPNGAGKSNLMDAISFVLGVRSNQLRSTQLKDLVYRGRKALPTEDDDELDETLESTELGAGARTAHVMAVYQDDNEREWRFKRSISTSGQSAYYFNSRETSFKAYSLQLEKFNILVKAKNFLVFQGDVEGVASQDSKQLAQLIDRISGSAELSAAYDKAKQDQDKAAETSTSNYAKKRSMLTELKHFKEQREEVRQWEKLTQERDETIQRQILWRLYHLTNDINDSTRKVEHAGNDLTRLRLAVNQDETKLRDAKKEMAQAQLQVKKREVGVHRAEKLHEDKKPELVAIEAQIAHSDNKSRHASTLLERVERDEERQAESVHVLKQGLEDITQGMEEAAQKQRQKSRATGKTLSKADLEDYRKLRSDANNQAIAERQQVETIRREEKSQKNALTSTEDKVQQAVDRKTKIAAEVDSLQQVEGEVDARVSQMAGERERIKSQLEQAQAERERISIKETELNEKLQDVFGKLLSAGADKRESEREAKLKEVLGSLKRIFPGVLGRVVDLCKPTSRKYDTAILTVLSRNLDAVVVEQEKVAIDCIEYMRNQRAGQATFIPLDSIQVKPVQEKYRNYAKGARLAIDCIEYEPAVERAMQHACGSSLICDTMDIAKHICYERNQEVKAVTIEGTIIHKSGLITGGQGASVGRRFNDNDVQSLQRAKETYLHQLQELNRTKPQDKNDEGMLRTLSRLDAELSIAKDEHTAARLRLDGLRTELKHVESDLKKSLPEQEKKARAVRITDDKLFGLMQVVRDADDKIFGAFCRKIKVADIREYEDVELKMAKEESEAMEKFVVQKGRLSHQIEFESGQLRNTRDRLASLRSTVESTRANVKACRSTRQTLTDELSVLQSEIERQREKLDDALAAFKATSGKVDELRDGSRKTQRALDKALKEIAGWNDEIEKHASDRHAIYRRCRFEEIDLPLVSGRLDRVPIEEDAKDLNMDIDDDGTQAPLLINDFGVEPDFDSLEDEEKESGDEEVGRDFDAQIARLKADLEKMAPNMKAIDRLADVQAGLEDAEREADDTRRESRLARDQFQELKKKRCDLFNKAYGHMSGCIDKIYKDLTKSKTFPTGGVGFLSLEDAVEPYLSGVKYNVMPPGKRFVEMEQLSGGEKTMAALALLFAIHSFHPAPFFVLDEVDAALDPSNVSKLARYVRDQAEKNVQFLIISLKATLYEHADGLVGVYREQDHNTSKTLTLDLRKYVE